MSAQNVNCAIVITRDVSMLPPREEDDEINLNEIAVARLVFNDESLHEVLLDRLHDLEERRVPMAVCFDWKETTFFVRSLEPEGEEFSVSKRVDDMYPLMSLFESYCHTGQLHVAFSLGMGEDQKPLDIFRVRIPNQFIYYSSTNELDFKVKLWMCRN